MFRPKSIAKHSTTDTAAPTEAPRSTRDPGREDPDSDVVSVLHAWLQKSGATLDEACPRYRRRSTGTANPQEQCPIG